MFCCGQQYGCTYTRVRAGLEMFQCNIHTSRGVHTCSESCKLRVKTAQGMACPISGRHFGPVVFMEEVEQQPDESSSSSGDSSPRQRSVVLQNDFMSVLSDILPEFIEAYANELHRLYELYFASSSLKIRVNEFAIATLYVMQEGFPGILVISES
jgi:hypothetical protein